MKNINKCKVLSIVILVLILLVISKALLFINKYPKDKYVFTTNVYIESMKKLTETSVSYNVKIGKGFKDKFILKIYMSDELDEKKWSEYTNLKSGDVIKIDGKIQIPEIMNNPGEFNYKYYLYSNNVYGEIIVNRIIEKVEYKLNVKEKIMKCIYIYREYLGNILDKHMEDKYSSVAKSIVYGDTLDISEDVKMDFEKAGVSHIMAISGSNIVGLVSVITIILNTFKLNKNVGNVLSMMVIIIYIMLAGASLSTLRAGIMCIICSLQRLEKAKSGKDNSTCINLLITVIIIMIYAPFSIYNIGFILSVLATLGIVMFSPYFTILKEKIILRIKNKVLKRIIDMLLTNLFLTLSVQVLILPVQINSFNTISLTSILSNVFCSLISSIITVIGSIYICFSWLPIVSYILAKLLSVCIMLLLFIINLLKNIPLEFGVMDLNIFAILTYYIFIFLAYLRLYLTKVYSKRKLNLKKYTIVQFACICLVLFFIVFSNIYFKYLDNYISFFNVGQGELSLIKNKENMVIVDIGSIKSTLAYNSINGYFKMKNIKGVDAIILSHMHTDHINGLESFVKEYTVKKIIYAKPFSVTDEYINFLRIVEEYDLEIIEAKAGNEFVFGEILVQILLPDVDEIFSKEDKEGLNTNSLVCKISVKDKDVLYMGDATYDTEKSLLEKYNKSGNMLYDIEVLKIGHHGSKTSTSEEYVKVILPKYGVISSKEKYYGHPHKDVIEILKENKVQIYITEKVGYIKFNMNKL